MSAARVLPGNAPGTVRTRNLTVRYDAEPVVHDVTFSVEQGEFVLVTGPSGCGKSTLALALTGLIPRVVPAEVEGSVLLAGHSPAALSAGGIAGLAGIVFQNPSTQLFNYTVEEELACGPVNLRLSAHEIADRVEWAAQAVGITHLLQRVIHRLSGGERQRVAIAAVLAMRPDILILDEPTANLDHEGASQIVATLERLNREAGTTIILIEHRLHPFVPLANRVVLMREGHIAADGPPEETMRDESLLSEFGLRNPWFPVGPRFNLLPPEGIADAPESTAPLVALDEVNVRRGKQHVLRDVNLALYPGQFVALVGGNGAGKTTMAHLLAGILRPQRGRIRWNRALTGRPRGRRVGLLFQNPQEQLFCDTVWDEVAFAPANFRLSHDEWTAPALAAAGLHPLRERHPLALSMGQQQRTALAATLSADPSLLILDEPTMGQDWGHLERLMEFLRRLHAQGHTILLISHDEKLVYHYAERIIILQDGRISADGPPQRCARTMLLATLPGPSASLSSISTETTCPCEAPP